jgi:hypothetical protein
MTEQPLAPARRGGQARRWLVVTVAGAVIAAIVGIVVQKLVDTGTAVIVGPSHPAVTSPTPPPVPVKVNVNTNPPSSVTSFAGQPFDFVLPAGARPGSVPPDDCSQLVDWAHQNGGADARASHMRIVVQGATNQGVLIENMRAKIVKRTDPATPSGTEVGCGGTQGEAVPRIVGINLDGPDLDAKYQNPTPGQRSAFGFTLADGETEVFDLTASLTKGTVEWVIELDLVVGGERTTVEVTNGGKSFVTTAWQSPHVYHFLSGIWSSCTVTGTAKPSCTALSSARDIVM